MFVTIVNAGPWKPLREQRLRDFLPDRLVTAADPRHDRGRRWQDRWRRPSSRPRVLRDGSWNNNRDNAYCTLFAKDRRSVVLAVVGHGIEVGQKVRVHN